MVDEGFVTVGVPLLGTPCHTTFGALRTLLILGVISRRTFLTCVLICSYLSFNPYMFLGRITASARCGLLLQTK